MRQPPAKVKNRQIAFVFCFGLPSVWERSTKLRIHRSHSCNFFYRSYSRILAPYCNSSHITKAIAIEWGVKSSLYKCYMITYPSVLRSPSVFRVWAAIPSEYMALSQTFSVTSHVLIVTDLLLLRIDDWNQGYLMTLESTGLQLTGFFNVGSLKATQTKTQNKAIHPLTCTSWWFQPTWKILVKLGIFPK